MFSIITASKLTQTLSLTYLNFSTTLLLRRFFIHFSGTAVVHQRRDSFRVVARRSSIANLNQRLANKKDLALIDRHQKQQARHQQQLKRSNSFKDIGDNMNAMERGNSKTNNQITRGSMKMPPRKSFIDSMVQPISGIDKIMSSSLSNSSDESNDDNDHNDHNDTNDNNDINDNNENNDNNKINKKDSEGKGESLWTAAPGTDTELKLMASNKAAKMLDIAMSKEMTSSLSKPNKSKSSKSSKKTKRTSAIASAFGSLLGESDEEEETKDSAVNSAHSLLYIYIIHPTLPAKMMWDVFVAILILYSVILIPYRICFEQEAVGFLFVFDNLIDVRKYKIATQ